jgi:hypothetical protein
MPGEWSLAVWLLAAILLSGMAWPQALLAQKGTKGGGGGTETPPTRIYFHYGPDTWAMNPDGSNKQLVASPSTGGEPSSRPYAGSRLWLRAEADPLQTYVAHAGAYDPANPDTYAIWPHYDLAAVRTVVQEDGSIGEEVLRLTDLFGRVIVAGAARWSNDGQDTFLSFVGNDISLATEVAEDGTTLIDVTQDSPSTLYRLNLSGLAIASADETWMPVPLEGLQTLGPLSTDYDWSPGGDKVVFVGSTPANSIWIRDFAAGEERMIWAPTYRFLMLRWSPDGSTIACHGADLVGNFQLRGIWKLLPDGSQAPSLLIESTGTKYYSEPQWSPDGRQIAYRLKMDRIDQDENMVGVLSTSSGKGQTITGDLEKTVTKAPIRWVRE